MRHFVLNSVLRASLAVYAAITRDRRPVHPRGVVSVTLYDTYGLVQTQKIHQFERIYIGLK